MTEREALEEVERTLTYFSCFGTPQLKTCLANIRTVLAASNQEAWVAALLNAPNPAPEPCPYCSDGKRTGLPGNACENCMNTGLKYPERTATPAVGGEQQKGLTWGIGSWSAAALADPEINDETKANIRAWLAESEEKAANIICGDVCQHPDVCDGKKVTWCWKKVKEFSTATPAVGGEELCSDCPPVGYPTDKTRCDPCPRQSEPVDGGEAMPNRDGMDGTDRLCQALYERKAAARDYLGGSDAKMLHDAADRLARPSSPLRAAAERVCWFDWSDNDMDAVAAIDALRKAITSAAQPASPLRGRDDALEEAAQYHDRNAADCRAIALVNLDNDLGVDSKTHAVDHEIAAEDIRAMKGSPPEQPAAASSFDKETK